MYNYLAELFFNTFGSTDSHWYLSYDSERLYSLPIKYYEWYFEERTGRRLPSGPWSLEDLKVRTQKLKTFHRIDIEYDYLFRGQRVDPRLYGEKVQYFHELNLLKFDISTNRFNVVPQESCLMPIKHVKFTLPIESMVELPYRDYSHRGLGLVDVRKITTLQDWYYHKFYKD